MIKPIPKRKLPNSVSYKAYLGNSGEGDTYDTATTLNYVKIDEQKQLKVTNNGREIVGNAMLYYDYVNSSGLVARPINNSIIEFEGRTYHIVDTDILRADSSTPHHYEVLLK